MLIDPHSVLPDSPSTLAFIYVRLPITTPLVLMPVLVLHEMTKLTKWVLGSATHMGASPLSTVLLFVQNRLPYMGLLQV